MLAVIYILALGLLLAVFTEISIATFLAKPESRPNYHGNEPETPPDVRTQREEDWEKYSARLEVYHAKVSIFSLIFATVLLCVSLLLPARLAIICDGIMLGGVFTLVYGAGVCVMHANRLTKFFVALLSLAVVLVLGYLKFVPH